MQTWQIQEAKSHFNTVIDCAMTQGAQSVKDYEQMSGKKSSLISFMMNAPKVEALATDRQLDPWH